MRSHLDRCWIAIAATLAIGCNSISGLHDFAVIPGSGGEGSGEVTSASSATAGGGDLAGATAGSFGAGGIGGAGDAPGGAGGTGGVPVPCGNGVIDPGEECDDANATTGDGCAACLVECDPPAVQDPATRHCYQLFDDDTPWPAAVQACAGLLPGSTLASLATLDEVELIRDQIIPMANDDFWLGASDASNEGDWQWLDGSPFVFEPSKDPWSWGQPDGGGGENCLKMGNGGAKLGDQACDDSRWFLCERVPAGGT